MSDVRVPHVPQVLEDGDDVGVLVSHQEPDERRAHFKEKRARVRPGVEHFTNSLENLQVPPASGESEGVNLREFSELVESLAVRQVDDILGHRDSIAVLVVRDGRAKIIQKRLVPLVRVHRVPARRGGESVIS